MKRLALNGCLVALMGLLASQAAAFELELTRHIANKNRNVGSKQQTEFSLVDEEEAIPRAVVDEDSGPDLVPEDSPCAAALDGSCGSACGSACNACCSEKCLDGCPCLCGACCNQGGWTAGFEVTWFRYHRADGARVGVVSSPNDGDIVEFDFEQSPRFTVGYVGPDGLGIRARWWQFDHNQEADNPALGALGVDTYNIDIEFFEEIDLTPCASMEVFAGLRYNDFDENFLGPAGTGILNVNSSAYGGVFGTQVTRKVSRGSLFARVRGAILMDDANVSTPNNFLIRTDVTQGMTEFATGVELVNCTRYGTIRLTLGVEWQNWYNFSTEYATNTNGGPTDVGFGGITTGFSFER